MINANNYWKRHEKPCPYAEGNRCFIVDEPSDDSCKGCMWYEWHKQHKAEVELQESESKRCMELAKSYSQGVRAGLAESEDKREN